MTDLDKLGAALAAAERRCDDLRTAIRVLRELHGVHVKGAPLISIQRVVDMRAKRRQVTPTGVTRETILQWMAAHGGGPFKPAEIAQGLGVALKAVANRLHAMKATGGLVVHDTEARQWSLAHAEDRAAS